MRCRAAILAVKTCALLLGVALFGGCESTAAYHYDGTLYRADGHTPMPNTRIEVLPSLDAQPTAGTAGTDEEQMSDAHGHIKGTITITTEKVFVKKDDLAPPLKSIFIYVHHDGDWQELSMPLDETCQKEATPTDRNIHLPPIIVPEASPASAPSMLQDSQ